MAAPCPDARDCARSARPCYCFFTVNPTVNAYHAFEVPITPGVQFHDLLTISLNAGTITHVINDTGATTPINVVPVDLVSYP